MKMKEMPKAERPREKMIEAGPAGMSNGELLAIIIRNGNSEKSALDLARELLSSSGNSLSGVFSMSFEKMKAINGIGPCKAAEVMAALELGRRFLIEKAQYEKRPIVTSRMVYDLMIPRLKGLSHEECWVIFLTRSNYVSEITRMTSGGLSGTVIDVRSIVKSAIEKNASGLILVHNHPGGNPSPSAADNKNTAALKKAAAAFDISVLDHVIVCNDCFFSYSDDRKTIVAI